MSDTNDMIVVGSVDEMPQGKMKHVEVKGKEIVISNKGGKSIQSTIDVDI